MRKVIIGILLSVLVFSSGCKIHLDEEKEKVNKKAEIFEQKIESLEEQLEELEKEYSKLFVYKNIQKNLKVVNPEDFEMDETGIYYNKDFNQDSFVVLTGIEKITRELKETVFFTEPIEKNMEAFFDSNPSVCRVFITRDDGYYRSKPAVDVKMYTLAQKDFSKYDFYQKADPFNNRLRKTIYIDKLYLDFFSSEWVFSLVTPAYIEEEFIGVVGINVCTDTIRDEFLEENMLLVNANGNILSIGENAKKILNISTIDSAKYGWNIYKDYYIGEEYNIIRHPSKKIRSAFEKVVESRQDDEIIIIDNRSFVLVAKKIESTGWFLIKMVEQ